MHVLGQAVDKDFKEDTNRSKGKEINFPMGNQSPNQKITNLHGLHTTMQVEILAPNHLRLLDESKPPDPHANVVAVNQEGEDDLHMGESDNEDFESTDMVEDTPTHLDA